MTASNHTVLTIYTDRFDQNENIVGKGMSGKVFLDFDNQLGMEFSSLDSALEYCFVNNTSIDRIDFNYVNEDGVQMFRKFKVEP